MKCGGTIITNFHYADDSVLMGTSEEDLQILLNRTMTENRKYCKELEEERKKKVMVATKKKKKIICIRPPGLGLLDENVEKIKYLGTTLNWYAKEISKTTRIALPTEADNDLKSISRNEGFLLMCRKVLVAYVFAIVTCNCGKKYFSSILEKVE